MATRIMVVDDERGIADSLDAILTSSGYECVAVYNAFEALLMMPRFQPHLIITDVVMPNMTGVELVLKLRATHPELPIVLLSGNAATEELLADAGAALEDLTVLAKPFSPRRLLRIIAELTDLKTA